MKRIFISYAHIDAGFVSRLTSDLQNADFEVFFDKGIAPGRSWAQTLASAIESSDFFLVALSPHYIASPWAQEELQLGLSRETEGQSTVIPLLVHQCEPPTLLAVKTFADFSASYETGLARLLPVLLGQTASADGLPLSGKSGEILDQHEIALLTKELKEAVQLFKGRSAVEASNEPAPQRIGTKGHKCFIVMPLLDEDLNVVYEDFVKPIAENAFGLRCQRADDIFGSNVIMDDILTSIKEADIVIADLTRRNTNVFYEVGICHALGKSVVLLSQSIDDVPFDLRHRRILLYDYTPRGCKRLEAVLTDNLRSILSNGN